MLNWIKTKWDNFEAWVATKLPGWKTKGLQLLTLIGVAATAVSSYLMQIPLTGIVEAKTLMIIMAVVSTLSFWLKDLGERVEKRQKNLKKSKK
jgi:hypothetical protein